MQYTRSKGVVEEEPGPLVYPPIILLHSTIEYGLSQSELLIAAD
jgi:hypothetical protein